MHCARLLTVFLVGSAAALGAQVGTPVAFCLLQNGVKTLVGVGKVALVGGIPVATVDLAVTDGDTVPNVNKGDVLQTRQRMVAPFNPNPGCAAPLLISASFQ